MCVFVCVRLFTCLFVVIVVRLLIPVAELDLFNSLVSPFEQEAYDILKCRSGAYKQERHELEEPLAHNANLIPCVLHY